MMKAKNRVRIAREVGIRSVIKQQFEHLKSLVVGLEKFAVEAHIAEGSTTIKNLRVERESMERRKVLGHDFVEVRVLDGLVEQSLFVERGRRTRFKGQLASATAENEFPLLVVETREIPQ
jgi:hypothetical protein